jgi:adenylate kinase family enzyme
MNDTILIVGYCGSGKTTLAIDLARKLNIPIVHTDDIFYEPYSEFKKKYGRRPTQRESKNYTTEINKNYASNI